MRRILLVAGGIAFSTISWSQQIDKIINEKEVERIEKTLSSDDMQGRRTFTPGIDKAADFIAAEFKKAGIQQMNGSYFQEFTVPQTENPVTGNIDGKPVDPTRVAVISARENFLVSQDSGYQVVELKATDTLQNAYRTWLTAGKNLLVFVDPVHAGSFGFLSQSRRASPSMTGNVVLLLGVQSVKTYSISLSRKTSDKPLKNVVGMIPGKSKKDEIVIFSAHYDHLGITKPNAEGDSIYNGANDDAAGTTAVIMLANYFAKQKNNERTIVFAAFTGEEVGMFGSKHFSRKFDSSKVMAMFNIEMIGTESQWGKNSAYITGYDQTDLAKILEKNLKGSKFTFHPDPYTAQQLFYRSDNATLARQGVAAHTISTSKMDTEKYYHTVDDEIETLDMKNMAEIIKAIAVSSTSIIAGKDTPSRVNTKGLR